MENKELIPFSKKLWESGEYEVVTRAGEKDVQIYDINFPSEEYSMAGRIRDEVATWCASGRSFGNYVNTDYDLMLRKKTKKVWIPTFSEDWDVYNTKEDCDKAHENSVGYNEAIEVEI